MPVEYQLPAGAEQPPLSLGRRGTPLTGPLYPPGWTQEDEQMFQTMSAGIMAGTGGVRALGGLARKAGQALAGPPTPAAAEAITGAAAGLGRRAAAFPGAISSAVGGLPGAAGVPGMPTALSPQRLIAAFEEVANDVAFWEKVHGMGPAATGEATAINREVARRLGVTEDVVRAGWASTQKGAPSPATPGAGIGLAEQGMARALDSARNAALRMPPYLRSLPFMGSLALGGLGATQVLRFLAQAPVTTGGTTPSSWGTEAIMHPGTMVGAPSTPTLAQTAGYAGLGPVTSQETEATAVPAFRGPGARPLAPGQSVEIGTGQVATPPQTAAGAPGGPALPGGVGAGLGTAMPAGMEDLLRSYAESERGYLALKQKEQQLTEMLAKSRLSGQYEGQETLEAEIERGLQEIQRQLAQYEGERVRGGLELGRRGIESEYRQGMAKLAGTAPARWFE